MTRQPRNLIRECADDLALTVGELMSIAKTAPKRYYVWELEKRSGNGKRTVCHPARELKAVQYYFLNEVLAKLPVHPSATAYVHGGSIKKNAAAHLRSRVIMKLDFADFFNSLKVSNWRRYAKQHFLDWSDDELDFSCQVLFWGSGTYLPKCLAIGSPTSPLLSNALMYEVDVRLTKYAEENNLIYTRYADDITFSSRGVIDYVNTLKTVKIALRQAKNTSLRLNDAKTIIVSNRSMRRVTGLIITPERKLSLGRDRKRLISAMVHHASRNTLAAEDWPKLVGLLAFAADVEPTFMQRLRLKYSSDLLDWIMRYRNRQKRP